MEKYITLEPRKIAFVNEKGKPIEGMEPLDWAGFFYKIEDHPKWATTYKMTRYMSEIWEAFEEAQERGDWVMVLKETPYNELKAVCENPKFCRVDPLHGPQEHAGWGLHPRLNRQILPFTRAIMNAVDEDPRKKAAAPLDVEEEKKLHAEEAS